MIAKDKDIYKECKKIESRFFEDSGILNCELYHEQRNMLIERIISSASIFLFGGRVYVLNNRLRFYQLSDIFKEALNQGSNMFGISAGSIVMTENFALNFEEQFKGGFIRAEDFGMGLTNKFWVFPHANDYRYITQADASKLSLFAIRHFPDVCVGLSCNSILRCQKYKNKEGEEFEKFTSSGHDPVLVFGARGRTQELDKGDQIMTKETEFFTGENMVFTGEEIQTLNKKKEMNELKNLENLNFNFLKSK